jgi:hypothetical protein
LKVYFILKDIKELIRFFYPEYEKRQHGGHYLSDMDMLDSENETEAE